MSTPRLTRRSAIAVCGALALVTGIGDQNALAESGRRFGNIRVDVARLRTNAGDQIAAWVQQELPGRLAEAMAARMAPNGATLVVRVDYLTFGPIKDSAAWDNISGVAVVGDVERPVRATARHQVSAIDQTMIEQTNHYRVAQLVQALTFWLARDL